MQQTINLKNKRERKRIIAVDCWMVSSVVVVVVVVVHVVIVVVVAIVAKLPATNQQAAAAPQPPPVVKQTRKAWIRHEDNHACKASLQTTTTRLTMATKFTTSLDANNTTTTEEEHQKFGLGRALGSSRADWKSLSRVGSFSNSGSVTQGSTDLYFKSCWKDILAEWSHQIINC